MPHPKKGERTPGSGKPKGYKAPATLDKLAAREFVRQRVTAALGPMLDAQIAHARGVGHVFTRDRHGKYTRIEDADEIAALLENGAEGETFHIYAKDPSVQAFTDLLNRALDKPKEQAIEVQVQDTTTMSDDALKLRVAAIAASLAKL